MLKDLTIAQYAEALSSAEPTPGGGSSLALAALNAACLVKKAAAVTLKKLAKNGQTDNALVQLLPELDVLERLFTSLIDDDAEAFAKVIDAMKMPKNTLQEKAARQEALQLAYLQAAQIALILMEKCKVLVEIATGVALIADKYVALDAAIGERLARFVARNSFANVCANTDLIEAKHVAEKIENDAKAIVKALA